jgi:tryptophanyl-tRNA synthetase
METPQGKTILSGIQPSGNLHLGNYLGAIKQWVALQADNDAYFCIVDLHAITVPYNPAELQTRILDAAAMYLACGVDPGKSTIFVQSHVPAHAELAWLLGTITHFGELSRMIQFKTKSNELRELVATATQREAQESGIEDPIQFLKENPKVTSILRNESSPTLGLLAYPVLQAGDILLYQADIVPVGEDQVQHIELTRDIARRFKNLFVEKTFKIPKAYLKKGNARIMSLTNPTKKMSKSDNAKSYIALTDEPESIRKKIMAAVTETDFNILNDTPSINNLRTIYHILSEDTLEHIDRKFSGKGYKEFKEGLAELIVNELEPIRKRFHEIRGGEAALRQTLESGREKAAATANKTLQAVKAKMGLA